MNQPTSNRILPGSTSPIGNRAVAAGCASRDANGQDLVAVVLDVVASLDLPRAGLHSAFPNPEGLSVLTLLSVLTYSYASGRLASDEIEEACRLDPALGYLCGGRLPSSPTVRRFRRVYRSQVTQALYRTLCATDSNLPCPPSDTARADLLTEVRRRIESAILADTIALDV